MGRVDAPLCVLAADQPISASEREFFAATAETFPRLLFVVNRLDVVAPEDRHEALEFIADSCGRRCLRHPRSSRSARAKGSASASWLSPCVRSAPLTAARSCSGRSPPWCSAEPRADPGRRARPHPRNGHARSRRPEPLLRRLRRRVAASLARGRSSRGEGLDQSKLGTTKRRGAAE